MSEAVSHIIGTLWVGSAPPPNVSGVDVLVLCAKEYQPPSSAFRHVRKVVHIPFSDTFEPKPSDVRAINSGMNEVRKALNENARVLVTCAAGLNRSVLVASLALMLPGKGQTGGCMDADKVIRLMRRKRSPDALMNPVFSGLVRKTSFCRS